MTVDLEQLAFTLCPHIRRGLECRKCPRTFDTDYGPATNLCRLRADAAARDAVAVIEPEEGR